MLFDTPKISQRLDSVNKIEPLLRSSSTSSVLPRNDPASASPSSRLATIVAARKALQNVLVDLLKLEDEARQQLDQPPSLLSPIFRLPTDVMHQIFQLGYTHRLLECDRQSVPSDPSPFLLAITQTCREWRSDALSLRQLWSRIHVEWDSKKRALWLQRAGHTASLDIHVQGLDENRLKSYEIVRAADIFLHTIRWRSISISHCGNYTADHFLHAVLQARTHFPILDSISVKLVPQRLGQSNGLLADTLRPANEFRADDWDDSADEEEANATQARLVAGLPQLRHITLHRANFAFEHLIYHALTLDVDNYHPSSEDAKELRRSLKHAKSLQSLSLSNLYFKWERHRCTPDRTGIPNKEHLQRLVLGQGNNKGVIRFVIHELQAPMLRYLRIWTPADHSEGYYDDLKNRFTVFLGSSPNIETLTLYGSVFWCSELLRDVADDRPGTSSSLLRLQNLTIGPDTTWDPPFWAKLNHVVGPLLRRQLRYRPQTRWALTTLTITDGPEAPKERKWLKQRVQHIKITGNIPLEEDKEEREYELLQEMYLKDGKVLDSGVTIRMDQRTEPESDEDPEPGSEEGSDAGSDAGHWW